ncbi:NCS2 family permease [Planctomicrobium sp. SH664]|uniref:NCS2 family permease n=1 Tax=Planctomicrobium sp. SH664 TaxID=3448125 RepID=UPI003F5BCE27
MRLFVKRDLDGFFGLFVDNLVQVLLIISFCKGLCGMTDELLYRYVLPGTAVSVVVGNLFYSWLAHRLAKREKRDDVTALPFGINTPSLIVFVFFVIKPEFDRTGDPQAAWRMGLLACLGSGIIEFLGAFVGERIRRSTPRAALLSTLAGIAITFISMTFALQIFQKPLIAMLPMTLVLIGIFAGVHLPLGLPSGLVAVLIGTALAWLMTALKTINGIPEWVTFGAMNVAAVRESIPLIGWSPPQWCGPAVFAAFQQVQAWVPFISVVIPMGLFNVIGSMQNIESAEAAGDKFPTAPAMAVNGLSTIGAALLGSCFPTTIYIGHPGWKSLGARAGYSTLNGLVITALGLSGLFGLAVSVIPIEAGAAIVLWIGIIITAQAFQSSPSEHAPAVAMGLFPAIAAWGATVVIGALGIAGGSSLQQILERPVPVASAVSTEGAALAVPVMTRPSKPTSEVNGFLLHGLLLMERGYIFTCMILSAAGACLIDRRFVAAGVWMLIAAGLTAIGVMHAYQVYAGFAFDYLFRFVQPAAGAFIYRADDITIGYAISGLFLIAISRWAKSKPAVKHH